MHVCRYRISKDTIKSVGKQNSSLGYACPIYTTWPPRSVQAYIQCYFIPYFTWVLFLLFCTQRHREAALTSSCNKPSPIPIPRAVKNSRERDGGDHDPVSFPQEFCAWGQGACEPLCGAISGENKTGNVYKTSEAFMYFYVLVVINSVRWYDMPLTKWPPGPSIAGQSHINLVYALTIFQWLLSWLLHKQREGYLLPT